MCKSLISSTTNATHFLMHQRAGHGPQFFLFSDQTAPLMKEEKKGEILAEGPICKRMEEDQASKEPRPPSEEEREET